MVKIVIIFSINYHSTSVLMRRVAAMVINAIKLKFA